MEEGVGSSLRIAKVGDGKEREGADIVVHKRSVGGYCGSRRLNAPSVTRRGFPPTSLQNIRQNSISMLGATLAQTMMGTCMSATSQML
ncbi:hypothetical protein GOP47_0007634 [Adiantum capillus-veneris]|uniref:Uncharacterized protein n=1 Tax=Adiantum capillus-veneris TaxID=13818 RepID=A0A9D4V1N3_ADICA|nr:hypothetical protein GOP47_0007634 [Adiantum capillus-veneris]